jgi:tripeptidyl-peptidase I
VSTAEELFMAEYSLWEHASGLDISCEEYHLPRHIQPHVDFVLPGVLMTPGKIKKTSPPQKRHTLATSAGYPGFPVVNSSSCNAYVTPACIKNQYGIPNGTTSRSGNSLGIYASDNEHYSVPDLNAFWPKLWPVIPTGTKPTDDLIDGAVSPANPSASPYPIPIGEGEADLDIEVAWPIIWPQKITVFQVDDQFYEQTESDNRGAPLGAFNSKHARCYTSDSIVFLMFISDVSCLQHSWMLWIAVIVPTQPTARLVTAHMTAAATPFTQTTSPALL